VCQTISQVSSPPHLSETPLHQWLAAPLEEALEEYPSNLEALETTGETGHQKSWWKMR